LRSISIVQGHNEDMVINVDSAVAEPAEVPTGEPGVEPNNSAVHLIKALWTMSSFTLILVISTVLYRPARGVVFGSAWSHRRVIFNAFPGKFGSSPTRTRTVRSAPHVRSR
jgi:hypothetical protein